MSPDRIVEVVFVGLPGPSHHYGGLSADNKASTLNRGSVSSPKQAALQALELVWLLKSLGVVVAVLPPQLRPHMPLLRQYFQGDDASVISQAALGAPGLLEKACASSAMWTANAATVTPGIDAADGRLHLTTANLFSNLHRRIEADDTHRVLARIFQDVPDAVVHPPLSAMMGLRDEGAANHMRLSPGHSHPGLHVFVYGAGDGAAGKAAGRQTLQASHAVALQHRLPQTQAGFIRQNREAIHSGVFHNDVIAVSNENLLLVHEEAYDQGLRDIERIAAAYRGLNPDSALEVIAISPDELTMEEAVQTYFFNSQIVTRPNGRMAVIAPVEAQLLFDGKAAQLFERIRGDAANPVDEVHYADLRQSMRNGGGPACLRLRAPMMPDQLAAVRGGCRVVADDSLMEALERVINAHYPDELSADELGRPPVYEAGRAVMQALSVAMQLPLL
jgi:succinylarginine dihydrolase